MKIICESESEYITAINLVKTSNLTNVDVVYVTFDMVQTECEYCPTEFDHSQEKKSVHMFVSDNEDPTSTQSIRILMMELFKAGIPCILDCKNPKFVSVVCEAPQYSLAKKVYYKLRDTKIFD